MQATSPGASISTVLFPRFPFRSSLPASSLSTSSLSAVPFPQFRFRGTVEKELWKENLWKGTASSHFGARFKLGCCGYAGLFDPGSIPLGSWPLGSFDFSFLPFFLFLFYLFFCFVSFFFLLSFSLSLFNAFVTFNGGGWSFQGTGVSFDNVRQMRMEIVVASLSQCW